MAELERWVGEIKEAGIVAVDTETTGLDEMRAELVGVSFALAPGKACYIPLSHVDPGRELLDPDRTSIKQIALKTALDKIRPLLEDPAILKIGQNIKYDFKILIDME